MLSVAGASAAFLSPTSVRTLRVGLPGPIDSRSFIDLNGYMDPARALVFPGLARRNPDGSLSPALLADLRPGSGPGTSTVCPRAATFHDGSPITASDIVRSLHEIPASRADFFPAAARAAKSARLVGQCIEIDMEARDPALAEVLDLPIFKVDPNQGAIGSGAYRAVAGEGAVTLDAIDLGAMPYGRFEFHGYGSMDELWKRLLAREVDLLPFVSSDAYAVLERYEWIRRWTYPSERVVVVRWAPNSRLSHEVRQAVALAVNRPFLVERLGDGSTSLATRRLGTEGPLPEPAKARALLGYEPGEKPKASVVIGFVQSFSEYELVARVLEADLARVGIEVRFTFSRPEEANVVFGEEDAHLTMDRLLGDGEDLPSIDREIALYRPVIRSAAAPEVCGVTLGPQSPLAFLDRTHPCPVP